MLWLSSRPVTTVAALRDGANEAEIRIDIGARIENRLFDLERPPKRADVRQRRRHPRALAVARGASALAVEERLAARRCLRPPRSTLSPAARPADRRRSCRLRDRSSCSAASLSRECPRDDLHQLLVGRRALETAAEQRDAADRVAFGAVARGAAALIEAGAVLDFRTGVAMLSANSAPPDATARPAGRARRYRRRSDRFSYASRASSFSGKWTGRSLAPSSRSIPQK